VCLSKLVCVNERRCRPSIVAVSRFTLGLLTYQVERNEKMVRKEKNLLLFLDGIPHTAPHIDWKESTADIWLFHVDFV
jgi:hypothetical protein